jgi:hypothetical protein
MFIAPRHTAEQGITAATFRRRTWLGLLLGSVCLAGPAATVRAESEFAVKAAYLYNFAGLIKWPSSAFDSADSPFVIGIVGHDPFGGLDNVLRGRKVGSRPVQVRQVYPGDAPALRACNILFVSGPAGASDVMSAVRGLPVLVVGEAEDFARRGGTVGFVLKNQKVKLEINRDAARRAQLSIPSDLLAISQVVESR